VKLDTITKLVIHELRSLGPGQNSDRRGPICDLVLADIPNAEHAINVATHVLQRVCSLLCEEYFWSDNRDKGPSPFTEQFEAWIDTMPMCLEGKAVSIRHKYWSQARVDEFLWIMLHLAKLHEWEVEDRRPINATHYVNASACEDENEEFLAAIQAWQPENSEEHALTIAEGFADESNRLGICPWRLLATSILGCPLGGGLPPCDDPLPLESHEPGCETRDGNERSCSPWKEDRSDAKIIQFPRKERP
jgi:hypothetical protein